MKLKVIVSILCLFLILFLACGHGGTPPQSTKLSLSFYGDTPSSYNCNNQSRFEVSFKPYNEPGLTGDYLWMFFKLQIDTVVFYESNDIMFPLSSDTVQTDICTLEFGGAIEGENLRDGYDIVGYLFRVEGGQPVEGVCTDGRYISVTPKTYFSKTMHIEYDCQSSYGLSSGTFAKLTAAFHIADTDTDIFRDEISLPNRDIPAIRESLEAYHWEHYNHHSQGYTMHLLSVQGLVNNVDSTAGWSTMGGEYGWSFIFVQDIFDFTDDDLHALYKTVVHELGHQRAGLRHASGRTDPHPEDHNSPFCVMNQDLSYEGNNDDDPNNDPPGLRRYFDRNPHFCPNCVQTIKNINW